MCFVTIVLFYFGENSLMVISVGDLSGENSWNDCAVVAATLLCFS